MVMAVVPWLTPDHGTVVQDLRFVGLTRLTVDLAVMPGPPCFLDVVESGPVTDGDLGNWPYCIGILLKFTAFLSSLPWPEWEE